MSRNQSAAPAFFDESECIAETVPARDSGVLKVVSKAATSGEPSADPSTALRVTREDLEPHMHLVFKTVATFLRRLPRSVQRDDLVAAGTYGLMTALSKHVGERGAEFEWYARVRIRGAIFDELRREDWLSRGARAKVTANAVDDQAPSSHVMVSMDELTESRCSFEAHDQDSPLALAEQNSDRLALSKGVALLPERERRIVQMHYFEGFQFQEIAEQFAVSLPRISQLHARALTMLKTIVADQGLSPA